MLRRVVRTVRLLLLVCGALLLAWIPFSWFFNTTLPYGIGPMRYCYCVHGELVVIWEHAPSPRLTAPPAPYGYEFRHIRREPFSRPTLPLSPRIKLAARTFTEVGVPLWLLAVLCLAWPGTSLILHRRRQRRGFEVRAGDGSTVSTADS